MQLFMLYKATQTVIEKAPIDAITILCKNTLAEERLLKNRVEHEILVFYIYSKFITLYENKIICL